MLPILYLTASSTATTVSTTDGKDKTNGGADEEEGKVERVFPIPK